MARNKYICKRSARRRFAVVSWWCQQRDAGGDRTDGDVIGRCRAKGSRVALRKPRHTSSERARRGEQKHDLSRLRTAPKRHHHMPPKHSTYRATSTAAAWRAREERLLRAVETSRSRVVMRNIDRCGARACAKRRRHCLCERTSACVGAVRQMPVEVAGAAVIVIDRRRMRRPKGHRLQRARYVVWTDVCVKRRRCQIPA
jgi:hypothetical protein